MQLYSTAAETKLMKQTAKYTQKNNEVNQDIWNEHKKKSSCSDQNFGPHNAM
jgi:hypothetical protein